jgi:hypothetical protein
LEILFETGFADDLKNSFVKKKPLLFLYDLFLTEKQSAIHFSSF